MGKGYWVCFGVFLPSSVQKSLNAALIKNVINKHRNTTCGGIFTQGDYVTTDKCYWHKYLFNSWYDTWLTD